MMMQMLDAGGIPALTDNIRTADEDNPKGYYEFEAVKRLQEDSSWVADAGGKVVKMVYRLLYDLPPNQQYRVVFMQRDLKEVIASQEAMLSRLGKPAAGLPPERLADVYRKHLNDVEQWLHEQPNFDVLYVKYRDVLERTDSVVQELNEFLGGQLNVRAMEAVPDRTLYRKHA
jgi:ElaB/YqjD/DUF883 family membrane-anchored ribosome-binding protein